MKWVYRTIFIKWRKFWYRPLKQKLCVHNLLKPLVDTNYCQHMAWFSVLNEVWFPDFLYELLPLLQLAPLSPTFLIINYYLSLITYHVSVITYHLLLFTYHLSLITNQLSLIIYYLSLITYHLVTLVIENAPAKAQTSRLRRCWRLG